VVSAPLAIDEVTVRCDVSIGIAVYPDHGSDVSALLRCADIAMYKSKENDDGPEIFSSVDAQLGASRLRTVEDFRVALDRKELILHYQPKLDLRTGDVTGVEALVRWQHRDRGLLYPDTFIEFVEEAGLMPLMTDQVLDQALDQAAVWRRAGRQLTVAVNLSARSLIDADLPASVLAILSRHDLPPSALQLEITESVLMSDHDRARAVLTELRAAGVKISVDDFGTGYSSLAYLRDLPIDELKLDQSFVTAMGADIRANALVSSTITLAHSLGLRMVAEGVDTEAALSELVRYDCDEVQGYYISRPVPANNLNNWLDLHQPAWSHFRLLTGRSA
jgi:EAL domain-containing protein (putative c-di-GMP-specific phosphodiesterase class I)